MSRRLRARDGELPHATPGSVGEDHPIEALPLTTSLGQGTDALVEHDKRLPHGSTQLDGRVAEGFETIPECAGEPRELPAAGRFGATLVKDLHVKFEPSLVPIIEGPAPRRCYASGSVDEACRSPPAAARASLAIATDAVASSSASRPTPGAYGVAPERNESVPVFAVV